MGEHSGNKDQRRHARGDFLVGTHRQQHQIGALVLVDPANLIEQDNGDPRYRKQPEKPRLLLAQPGRPTNAVVKQGSDPAYQQADQAGKQNPL